MDKVCELPAWIVNKYGKEYASYSAPKFRPIKGTKRYRKEQAKKKRQERRAAIVRVNALLEELAVIGY